MDWPILVTMEFNGSDQLGMLAEELLSKAVQGPDAGEPVHRTGEPPEYQKPNRNQGHTDRNRGSTGGKRFGGTEKNQKIR